MHAGSIISASNGFGASTVWARRRNLLRTAAIGLVAVTTVACSSSPTPAANTQLPSNTAVSVPATAGGSLVIGAEQEPDCTDWIATCGASIWGTWIMQAQTIPSVFDVRKVDGNWVPVASPMMAAEPTVTGGDSDANPQVITYKINPKAVWSDGEPITSADFKYTAEQIRDGEDIFDKTGYDKITDVETPDAQTAIVTLSAPSAGWKALFGSGYGILPAHLLEGKDRAAIMKDGYSFSGGPWIIESWAKGSSVTLVPNDKYWGEKPKLDKVTFQFTADTASAFQAFKSGQLDALYPTPQLDAIDQIKAGLPDANSQVDAQTGNLEALWMNNGSFPFDSLAVRQAVSYSIDRKAIVERLFGPLGVSEPAQSFLWPLVSLYAADEFSRYSLDLAKVDELMTADGWAKGGDGIWAKDGKPAAFTITSLAGNKRRELTEQVLQQQLATAGFTLTITNASPADLFSKIAPAGDFQMGLWTLVDTFPQPTLSASFNSDAIPSDANGQSGINFYRINVPGLNELLDQVNTELDETKRIALSNEADKLIADAAVSLPLDAVPNILLWNKKIGGPIEINPVQGPWWNLNEWGLA